VIHFFWDRILGTYRRPDARFRGQKGFPNQLVSDSKPHLLSRCDHRRTTQSTIPAMRTGQK
jgi:sterol desaturase/sphingolipid hydroxylase (fatty acid hydroxylase superfamily)